MQSVMFVQKMLALNTRHAVEQTLTAFKGNKPCNMILDVRRLLFSRTV